MYRRILLVSDGTPEADGALEAAIALASRFGAELHMILVEELPRFAVTIAEVDGEKQVADRRAAFVITSAERRAREAKVAFRSHVVVGHMIDHVLDFVNEHQIDLLVVAFRAPSNALSLFLTNRTERLIRLAPCDVHVVK